MSSKWTSRCALLDNCRQTNGELLRSGHARGKKTTVEAEKVTEEAEKTDADVSEAEEAEEEEKVNDEAEEEEGGKNDFAESDSDIDGESLSGSMEADPLWETGWSLGQGAWRRKPGTSGKIYTTQPLEPAPGNLVQGVWGDGSRVIIDGLRASDLLHINAVHKAKAKGIARPTPGASKKKRKSSSAVFEAMREGGGQVVVARRTNKNEAQPGWEVRLCTGREADPSNCAAN